MLGSLHMNESVLLNLFPVRVLEPLSRLHERARPLAPEIISESMARNTHCPFPAVVVVVTLGDIFPRPKKRKTTFNLDGVRFQASR